MKESHIERIVDRSTVGTALGGVFIPAGLGTSAAAAISGNHAIYPIGAITVATGIYLLIAVGVTVLRDESFEVMLFPAPRKRAAYDDVVEYSHRSRVTFGEAGGIGWRAIARGHRVLIMNPGPGVELLLRSGDRLTVAGKRGEALYLRLKGLDTGEPYSQSCG